MKLTFVILFALITSHACAQKIQSTTYLKFNNQEVNSLDSADFIRYIYASEKEAVNSKLIEKFKNGDIKKEGEIINKELPLLFFEGTVKQYNLNSSLYSTETFIHGMLDGNANYYHPNGKLYIEGFYRFNRGDSYLQSKSIYDVSGQNILDEKGNGWLEIFTNGIKIKGAYKNGFKEGIWKITNYKTKDTVEENYKNGKFYEGEITDVNGNKTIFKDLFTFPYINGRPYSKSFGQGGMRPTATVIKSNDKDGAVAYSFDIDRFGNTKNFKLLVSVSDYSDKKALEYIKKQRWHPASNRGRTFDTFGFIHIVQFHLD
jgi:antitoxin component YwqK of YwqJK toxin-antitoxin module